jgi:Double zinc ribbon
MTPLAYFGINSGGLNLAVDLVFVFVVVLYLSLIYWTYADARRRIADPWLIACSTVASLFPFIGTIIYMVLRPPEYLEDVRERELEMQAAEARLYQLDYELCPHCEYRTERDFIRCPHCLRKLKDRCVSCTKPLDPTWTMCPYCETEVAASTRSRRRRTTSEGETAAARASAESRSPRASAPGSRASGDRPTSAELSDDPEAETGSQPRTRAVRAGEPGPSRPRSSTQPRSSS